MKNVAVIILNYNTSEQTLKLLRQLDSYGYCSVVVDNFSSDESVNKIKEGIKQMAKCHLVCSESNGGYAKGNNLGIIYARDILHADYIAIVNPDIELVRGDTIDNLCQALEDDSSLAGITAMSIFNREFWGSNPCASRLLSSVEMIFSDVFPVRRMIRRGYKKLEGNDKLVAYVDKLQGCFFIMKLKTFEEIGFFDEHTFLYYEEDIIGRKVKDKGLKLGVLLSETVRHNHEVKEGEMQNKARRMFYNRCFLESKKYYMLQIMKANYFIWWCSFVLDKTTRGIKNLLCF